MGPHTTTSLLLACQAVLLSVSILFAPSSLAFVPTSLGITRNFQAASSVAQKNSLHGLIYYSDSLTSLNASGGGKRKKRRRKVPIEETESAAPPPQNVADTAPESIKLDTMIGDVDDLEEATEEDIFTLKDVAKFAFDEDRASSMSKSKVTIQ